MNNINERAMIMSAPVMCDTIRKQIQNTYAMQKEIRDYNNPEKKPGRPKNLDNMRKCHRCKKYVDISQTEIKRYWSNSENKNKSIRYCLKCLEEKRTYEVR